MTYTALIDLTAPMALPQAWMLVVSALIPLVVSAATAPTASNKLRQQLALAAVAVVAVLEQITADSFTLEGLIVAATVAAVTQLTAYQATNNVVDLNAAVLPSKGLGV